MYCKNCGKELPEASRFCTKCGEETGYQSPDAQPYTGPKAKIADYADSNFFGKEVKKPGESERTTRTALILGVFFGLFGGHCYYTGHQQQGFIKLGLTLCGLASPFAFFNNLTTLGLIMLGIFLAGGIWLIIDLIFIANGEYKDAEGKKLFQNF